MYTKTRKLKEADGKIRNSKEIGELEVNVPWLDVIATAYGGKKPMPQVGKFYEERLKTIPDK